MKSKNTVTTTPIFTRTLCQKCPVHHAQKHRPKTIGPYPQNTLKVNSYENLYSNLGRPSRRHNGAPFHGPAKVDRLGDIKREKVLPTRRRLQRELLSTPTKPMDFLRRLFLRKRPYFCCRRGPTNASRLMPKAKSVSKNPLSFKTKKGKQNDHPLPILNRHQHKRIDSFDPPLPCLKEPRSVDRPQTISD